MKNPVVLSLFLAALMFLPVLARADEVRFDLLRTYTLASGKGVAVAVPHGWQEMSKTRVLEAGAPARFLDGSGRPVEISAAAMLRASESKSVVWAEQLQKIALQTR